MKLAGYRYLRMRPQDQDAEGVAIVHHVEERKTREGPRRGQHLEESLVLIVVGIAIARAGIETGAQPGFEFRQHFGLDARFEVNGMRALLLHAPAPGLYGAP